MTRTEARRHWDYLARLSARWGITAEDAETLRRCEKTLHTWAEHECNGTREVDPDGTTWAYNPNTGTRWRTANRERGAMRRAAAVIARYPACRLYRQGDPRGVVLHIIDATETNPDARYDRGEPCRP